VFPDDNLTMLIRFFHRIDNFFVVSLEILMYCFVYFSVHVVWSVSPKCFILCSYRFMVAIKPAVFL